MNIKSMFQMLDSLKIKFYTGVPDSLLQPFITEIESNENYNKNHIIGVNEGNCLALAAGYYLSTGNIPCIYMQNSGQGNMINPMASLLNEKVYAIPCLLVIGWRAEPGIHDEPQHIFQGEKTLELLETLEIEYFVIDKETTQNQIESKINQIKEIFKQGKSFAFVVKKGALENDFKVEHKNNHTIKRERSIELILKYSKEDIIISTTGKTSRELFELREKNNQGHSLDFLTVGSMGHSSSIALSIALNKPNTKVWCIDGDGAVLMHMGAMAIIGAKHPANYIHIIINNEAHESVGGQKTVAGNIDFITLAKSLKYEEAYSVNNENDLINTLEIIANKKGPILIEIKSAIGSRKDLGRPTSSPIQNKVQFMDYLKGCK